MLNYSPHIYLNLLRLLPSSCLSKKGTYKNGDRIRWHFSIRAIAIEMTLSVLLNNLGM